MYRFGEAGPEEMHPGKTDDVEDERRVGERQGHRRSSPKSYKERNVSESDVRSGILI